MQCVRYGVLMSMLWMAGCSTVPTSRTLPPVEDRGAASGSYGGVEPYGESSLPSDGRVVIHPIERAPIPVATPLPSSPAVVALMQSATDQQRAGQLDSAAGTLERALRIEPGNARLWNQLAQVRLQQERWVQAEQMALKSNRLASGDLRLQAANWRLIGAAREGVGDASGSRDAQRKASEILQR